MPPQTVELSMIVKNEARTLTRCLTSVRAAVDRIVIGDTGSTDETISIAQSYGAEIVPVLWTGDFAAARNTVLRHSRCDWIFVLDADEMLDAGGAEKLKHLIQQPGPAAYDIWRWNYVLETNSRSGEQGGLQNPQLLAESHMFPAYVKSLNTRLFRRNPEVYFERPVHETVVYRLQTLALPVATAPFVIHHLGQAEDNKVDRARKNELYHQIGLQHLQANPDDARTCFELGLGELEHFKRPEAALSLFVRALSINPRDCNALIFAGVCMVRMQRYTEALDLLSRARELNSGSIVLDEAMGDAYFHQQQHAQAFAAYESAMLKGSASALVLAKWGVCKLYLGQREPGLQDLRQALQREPGFPELLDLVAVGAALAQDNPFAAAIARKRLPMEGTSAFHYALACILLRLSGDWTVHQEVVHEGLTRFPHDPSLSAEHAMIHL
ncbi:glycosyltransferase [Edaphobacter modestus]|nr:glycosyltransferase [Edaphobacter modestus]